MHAGDGDTWGVGEDSQDQEVNSHHQYVRREAEAAGLCTADLPWFAMPVKQRISRLRDRQQAGKDDLPEGRSRCL